MARLIHCGLASIAFCLSPHWAMALDGGTRGKGSGSVAPAITLPTFGELPRAEGLAKPKSEPLAPDPSTSPVQAQYSVVKIQNAKGFRSSSIGHTPSGQLLNAIQLDGQPLSTEPFATLVRVRSPQKVGAPIEVMILDSRGDVALSAAGDLSYRGKKVDEADYLVEWDRTPCRVGGDYQMVVRVAGRELGSWPLKFVEKK